MRVTITKRRLAAGGTAAALAITGVAATTAGAAWAVADDTTTSESQDSDSDASTTERPSIVERITEALAGLVDDGTITQDQASAVAEELASAEALRGPMGHGPHGGMRGIERPGLEAAAETLDLSEDELRSALRDGDSLAEIADEQGVAVDDLVTALVAAAEERLAEAVEDGRITQERADEIAAVLPERVAEAVERTWEPRGPGRHHGDRGGMLGDDGSTGDGSTEGSSFDQGA